MAEEQEETKVQEEAAVEEAEPHFEVGEAVIIREDFHSKYFQGLHGTIAGPGRKGGTPQTLWPVRLSVAPYETLMAGKYLRRPTEADRPVEAGSPQGSGEQTAKKSSWFSRLLKR